MAFYDHNIQTVDAVADLANISPGNNQLVQTLGYYTAGDGGGNLYRYEQASTDPCDGGFVLDGIGGDNSLAASNATYAGTADAGRFLAIDQTVANAKQFGAKGDITTDDTSRFQAMFETTSAPEIFIPDGQYSIESTVSFGTPKANRISVRGTGLSSRIDFNPTVANDEMFLASSGDNFLFEDLSFVYANANTQAGGTAINVANANVSACTFRRCYFESFEGYGVRMDSAQYFKFDECRFQNCRSSTASIAHAIRIDTFANAGYIIGCRFSDNDKDIRLIDLKGVEIRGCSFESGCRSSTATVDACIEASGNIGSLIFTGNYVEGNEPAAGNGFLKIEDLAFLNVSDNMFVGDFGGTTYTDSFIFIVSSGDVRDVQIDRNVFSETLNYFVSQFGYTGPVRFKKNRFVDASAEITTLSGLSTYITPSGAEFADGLALITTVDVPSIAAGSYYDSASVAHPWVSLGDWVEVTTSAVLPDGAMLYGFVVSAGNVRFRIANHNAAAIDPTSMDFKFVVRKR